MIPKEVLKEIKRIEIRTTRLVNDLFGGEYLSVFKGQGIEFADVREYVPGDDIRTIDWNVTARSQHPFVKKYAEERELTILFVVDASASQAFGTTRKLKSVITAEICALLAFAAVRNNDKVGMVIFSDEIEKFIPVKKGKSHVLRVIREVLYYKAQRPGTSISTALEYLQKTLKRNAVIFLVSDFLDSNFEKPLRVLSRKHDVIAIHLKDPREQSIDPCGLIQIEDLENGEMLLIDTRSASNRESYAKLLVQRQTDLTKLFKSLGIDKVEINTSQPYTDPLIKLFRMRERRYRRG